MLNFAGIHDNLHLKGNELKVRNVSGNILAFAGIAESFPEFGLEQARRFLLGMKRIKFSNPDWNFTSDRQLDVLENGGNFHWNGGDLDDESVFLKISKGMSEIPAPEMEFYMDRECIGKLKNACKKIDIKKLSIIGDGMHVSVGVSLEVDAKKGGLRNFALVLHPSTSKKFHFSFDVEILDKLLPRTDYNIGINLDGEGMLSFRRVSKGEANLIYYVDAEFHRDDKSANDIPASDSHDSTSLVGNGHGADNGGLDSEIHPAQQPDVEGNQALVNGSDDVFDENLPASEREQEPLPEVHEESVVMKVSEDTLKIMVNFAGIYKNLRLCGNELRIANEIRTIVAFADIPENFPEFKIERAKKFCQNVGKLSDPCWNFLTENGERGVYISKDRGSLHYNSAYLNDERMFLISMNRSVIPAPNILFNWEEKDIGKVKKMCKKLNIKKLSIVGDGEQISIGCKLEVSAIGGLSYYAHILHLSTEKINISFNTEILERLFPADYEIGFNTPPNLDGRGMLSFRRVSKGEANLIYYVITERHPDGEDTTDNFLVSGSIETPAKRCLPLVISHQPGDAVNIEQAIYHGDNLSILREMGTGTVDLIATDPPFNTGREWQGSSGAGFSDRWRWEDVREDWLNDIQRIEGLENYIAFVQKMSSSSAAFLCFMAVRLMEMGRVLKDNTGSIYLHCDQHAVCHLKMLMDGIFGKDKFCNMITWKRTTNKNHGNLKKFGRVCDYILFYAGSDNRISSKCQNLTDLWTDVPAVGSGKESTGYPTQKPVALYKRIIESSSNPGDVVLDPFVGSGTTLVAAKQLGRQWIGIDASEDACKVAQGRLMNLEEADLPAPEADNITEEQQLREASEIRLPKSNEGNAQTDCENGNGDVQPVADPNPQDSGDVTPLHNVADVNLDKEDKQTETKDYYYDRILVTNDTGAVVRRIYLKHEDLPNNAFNWNDAKKDTGYVSECYVKNPPKSYFYHLPSDFYGVHLVAHGETLEALEIDKERVLDISNEFMLIADSCILDRWNSVSKELFKKEKLYWAFKADKNNLRCRFIGIINDRYVDSKFTANDLKYLESQVNEFMQEQFSNYTEADIKKSRRNHRKAWKELNAWEAFMIEKPRSVFWRDILNEDTFEPAEDKTSKSSDVVPSLLAETCNLQGPDGSRPSTVHQKGKITLYTDPAQVPNHQDTFIAIPKQDVEFSNLPMPDTEETRKNRCDEMFEFIHREGFKMGKKKVGHYFLIVDEGLVIGIFHSLEEIYQYVKEGYPTADIERYKSFLSANGYPEDFHKLSPEVREEKINLNGSADLSAPEAGNIPKESRRNCA
ncbi:MAG: DNA methyltransferase [Hyphomicrobiales bacterium]|nr:DNA methyltransferase [Hyphomicrobiales bacterium]